MELEIQSAAFQGASVGRIDNLVVFVPYAVPGDRVRATVTRKRRRFVEAAVETLLEPSPYRRQARCRFFGTCGGCAVQNTAYAYQLEAKRKQVADLIQRIGGFRDVDVRPALASPNEYYYRNKMEFSFGPNRWLTRAEIEGGSELDKGFALGLHIPKRFDKILDIDECFLLSPESVDIVNFVRGMARELRWEPYHSRDHLGWLRNLVLRTGVKTGELMVVLVTTQHREDRLCRFAEALVGTFPEITTVVSAVNASRSPVAYGDEEFVLYGPGWIREHLGGLVFKITPSSFFQPNTLQAENLYSVIRSLAGITRQTRVYDLFCGVGSISLFLSGDAGEVVGVEAQAQSVELARENARMNGIENCRFNQLDAAEALRPDFLRDQGTPDVIILDPPRAGLHPQLSERLLSLKVPRIVYCSCNPSTQARDLQLLSQCYDLGPVQPVDMFPQTYHIESVAELRLKPGVRGN